MIVLLVANSSGAAGSSAKTSSYIMKRIFKNGSLALWGSQVRSKRLSKGPGPLRHHCRKDGWKKTMKPHILVITSTPKLAGEHGCGQAFGLRPWVAPRPRPAADSIEDHHQAISTKARHLSNILDLPRLTTSLLLRSINLLLRSINPLLPFFQDNLFHFSNLMGRLPLFNLMVLLHRLLSSFLLLKGSGRAHSPV
jgi:hypothetical protein